MPYRGFYQIFLLLVAFIVITFQTEYAKRLNNAYPLEHSSEEDENEENRQVKSELSEKEEMCKLDVNRDLPNKNEPLFLTYDEVNGTVLVLPEVENNTGIITLSKGEAVIIACPGRKNYVDETKNQLNIATCQFNTTFNISGKGILSERLNCHSRVDTTIKVTSKSCARGKGAIVEIGFKLDHISELQPEADEWVRLIEICYNFLVGYTHYSHHTLKGDRLAGKVQRMAGRPSFSKGAAPPPQGVNAELVYKQMEELKHSLSEEFAREILNSKSGNYLTKSQLAPAADFLLSPHQLATYNYANVAPQWHSINTGNWLQLEEYIRKMASKEDVELEVVTGVSGILRLKEKKGPRFVFLSDSKIPVPEFFWKVLRSKQNDSCIAFVASNNPFSTEKPRRLCKDVCSEYNWPEYQDDYAQGYIYCCEYDWLSTTLRDIPPLRCTSTLEGNHDKNY